MNHARTKISRTALVVSTYPIGDPPPRNASEAIHGLGYRVECVQPGFGENAVETQLPGIEIEKAPRFDLKGPLRILNGPLSACRYAKLIRRKVRELEPSLLIAFHLNDLAALPWPPEKYGYKLVSAILDVPGLQDSGRYDQVLFRRAWKRLARADFVWASDRYKAELAQQLGGLAETPLVCHNTPNTDYLPVPTWPRDGWLRAELRKLGASIGETDGCIVVRAGAVGEYCGIDETLTALVELPDDVIFLMMGRPNPEYKKRIGDWIAERSLSRRAFLWDRPTDQTWKKTLRGADVGHLVHGPYPAGKWQRQYQNNSSLSNNRLFQYFAAGLPVLAYDDPRMNDIYTEVPAFRVARLANLIEDFRRHIGELAADPAERERLGRIAREGHLKTYNWPVQFGEVALQIKRRVGA